jgi:hypothetical protein
MSERAHTAQRLSESAYGGRTRLAVVVGAVIVVVLIAWLIFKGDDNKSGSPARAPGSAASVSQLQALPGKVGHDVFWAGSRSGFTYELTQTTQGNIYVRYLPAGVQANDPRPDFLTVGTYPHAKAFGVLKKVSKNPGSQLRRLPGGGIAVFSNQKPNSVYVAYPGKDFEIEIFDPSPSRALKLAVLGRVKPLG